MNLNIGPKQTFFYTQVNSLLCNLFEVELLGAGQALTKNKALRRTTKFSCNLESINLLLYSFAGEPMSLSIFY